MNTVSCTNSSYFFTGSSDGRIFQYSLTDQTYIARLFSFEFRHTSEKDRHKKNAIRAITSYDNLLAASAFGGEIIVIDTIKRSKKKHILKSCATVTALMFLSKNRLISANVDGEIHIYNLSNNTTKKLVTTLHEIKQIVFHQESYTLIASANTNYISLIDLENEKVLQNKFYSFTDIVDSVKFVSSNKLLVSLKNSQKKELSFKLPTKIYEENFNPPILSFKGKKQLLNAYENNDFKLCYELIDTYNLYADSLALLLEKYWEKLVIKCEKYALNGDAKSILLSLEELLFIDTRSEKIGDLLRLSFFTKITQLTNEKLYKSAPNIIYSYIDIFGYDIEIAKIIFAFEKVSDEKIAIFKHSEDRKPRDFWRDYFQN